MRNAGVLRYLRVGLCMTMSSVADGHPPSIEDMIVNVLIDAEAIESFRVGRRFRRSRVPASASNK